MLTSAAAVAVAAAAPGLFETLRWTAPGKELAALSSQPAVCLAVAPGTETQVGAGHALFNSPGLLGGQAAKAGLSCASCHANGRDNPHFLMAGVSDQPGTADVTNSFFSAARGNGRFDPIIIPDLAMPGKVLRDPVAGQLEPFIRTLIVDEFAGQEPSGAMLAALAAYVRAVRACSGDIGKPVPRSLHDQVQLIRAALAGAIDMARRSDAKAARALIAAARHQLGQVSERYPGETFSPERALLLEKSRDLQALAKFVAAPNEFAAAIEAWTNDLDARLAVKLRQKETQSLYNPLNLGFVALQRDNR